MIAARRHALFELLFVRHARARIAGAFAALRVRGAAGAHAATLAAPILVVSNHTAWWDPLVALVITRWAIGAEGYALMDARNLRRFPFFGRVGAFGVDLSDPHDGARALRYGAKLLDRPGRLLWIFPQGRERPVTERPLAFRPGSAELARLVPRALVIPVGLRYELGHEERPVAWVSIGAPLVSSGSVVIERAQHEAAVAAELDRIDAAIGAGDAGEFPALIEGRTPRLATLATRVLGALTR